MKRQHSCSLFFLCGVILILLCIGGETSSSYLRKGTNTRSLQAVEAAAQRPNIFDGDSTATNSSSTTPTTPLNEPYEYTEDPFQSNVHQFINTTEIMLQDITTQTAVPSVTPPTATYISPSQPWYTGPTDPISPTSSPSTTSSTTRNNNNNDDDTDYREFMAFIGWYAFLILCCLLPTLCAYYKRRRNEYMVNENIDSIRLRLEEMERDSPGGVTNGFFGGGTTTAATTGGSGSGLVEGFQLGERDQDWEVLESLFATSSTGGNNSSSFGGNNNNVDHDIAAPSVATIFGSVNGGNRQRQMIMSDILGGMSIRVIMEREQRRKRERGLRLVGLLKETSLKVELSQLIPKEGIVVVGGDDDGGGSSASQGDGTKKEGEEGECGANLNSNNIEDDANNGDIELASIDNKARAVDVQEGGVPYGSTLDNNEEATIPGEEPSSIYDDAATNDDIEASPSNEAQPSPVQETDCVEGDATTTNCMLPGDSANAMVESEVSGVIADPQSSLLQTADETSSKENNIISLYQTDTDDIFDDDDDDNKYTALCLPCSSSDKDTTTSSNSVEATASSPLSLAQSAPPQSTMQDDTQRPSSRLVPPTCAICLVSYSPGCYVTWSSNPDCIHAFHRDCILMWLLKKEEPLCPCCRREFVSSSRLNTDTSTTARGDGSSLTPTADEYLRRRFVLERSQILAARSRYVNSIMPRPNQTEPPSHWQSLSTGRIRHF